MPKAVKVSSCIFKGPGEVTGTWAERSNTDKTEAKRKGHVERSDRQTDVSREQGPLLYRV